MAEKKACAISRHSQKLYTRSKIVKEKKIVRTQQVVDY